MTAPRDLLPGPLRRRDVALVAVVTVVELLGIRTGPPIDRPSALVGAAGLLLSLCQGLALLWRRHPEVVLAVVTVAFVAHALLLQPVPPYGSFAALALVAARRDVRTTAAATLSVVAACALGFLTADGPADDVVLPCLVAVGVAVSGQLVRERRIRAAALVDRAAAEERLRIARDLHDVLGHSLGGIAVQSSTGRLALDAGQPQAAREALVAIESASRDSMSQVRDVLSRLRDTAAPALDDLDGLVARAATADVLVSLRRTGDLAGVAPAVGGVAYRVVQESLTNAARHAAPCRVEVSVRGLGDRLLVEVTDDGAERPAAEGSTGHGLVGMRERVAAVGGRLTAGRTPDGGWRVLADLPTTGGQT